MSESPTTPSPLTGWRRWWFVPAFVVFLVVTDLLRRAAPGLLDDWYVRLPVFGALGVLLMGLGRRTAERLEASVAQ